MLTQDKVQIITCMLGTKEAPILVSCSTTNRKILFKFLLKKSFPYGKTEEQMKFPCIWVWRATRQSSKLKSVLILILHLQGKWVFCAMRYNNGNASLFPKPFCFFLSSFFFSHFFNYWISLYLFCHFFFFFLFWWGKKKLQSSTKFILSLQQRHTSKKKVMLTNYGIICWLSATIVDKQYQILIYNGPNHKRII